jgi:hypothetical protein
MQNASLMVRHLGISVFLPFLLVLALFFPSLFSVYSSLGALSLFVPSLFVPFQFTGF